jgi:urea carboxylase
MKMEFHISAPHDGLVKSLHCRPGMMISAGDPLVSLA